MTEAEAPTPVEDVSVENKVEKKTKKVDKTKPVKGAKKAAKSKAKATKDGDDDNDDSNSQEEKAKPVGEEEHDFDVGAAGASDTVPIDGKDLKVNNTYMLIKNHPCKLINLNKSAPGKHGHAKYALTGIDIFSGKKCEDAGLSHGFYAVNVKKTEYQLLMVDEDTRAVSVLVGSDTKDDLNLPNDTEDDEKLSQQIIDTQASGKDFTVTVITAMGLEKIVGMKVLTN